MTQRNRYIAVVLSLVMVWSIIAPTMVMALSSGPSQPEVQGFQAASASDMVDLFTGDGSYNIPLMDVDGYPLNLFYNSGIGMDQEASWVGLGWNLNPGVVDRNLRGIPDDFSGDAVVRTMNIRPNRTFGASYAYGLQIYSLNALGLVGNLNLSISPSFNNYNGCQFDTGVNFSMRSGKNGKSSFTGGLGMTSSSNRGLRMQPSIGWDAEETKGNTRNTTAGLNFGVGLDSKQGLTNLSFGASAKASKPDANSNKEKNQKLDNTGQASASFDFGAPAYTPQISLPMQNRSVSLSFTWGGAIMGVHPNMTLGASYSQQNLRVDQRSTPSYGYLHLDAGQLQNDAQLDFNREKDGPFSGDRAALGIPTLTNDFFSVSGQGVSGSYRAYRSEVGHVFDPATGSSGVGGSAGLDLGAGLLAHGGARFMVNSSTSESGRWPLSSNLAGQKLRYRSLAERPDLEAVYFREANEATVDQDSSLWTSLHKSDPVRFTIPSNGQWDNRLGAEITDGSNSSSLPSQNYRGKREPRKQLFSYLNHKMAEKFGLDELYVHPDLAVPDHHMSEVTILKDDGSRYVYGLPAYNKSQVDVEFNVHNETEIPNTGLIGYPTSLNGTTNNRGKDHYYSSTTTPPYAYSFLLTAQVSADYSDVDAIRGPSPGDLGNYTKFVYNLTHQDFPWRTPSTGVANQGRFIKNLPSTELDNKCTYSAGTKEVYYLENILTKNHIAVFYKSDREDAKGVNADGSLSALKFQKLDSIKLFNRVDFEMNSTSAYPIKTVHLDYDYSLCQGTPNSIPGGKLTLKKVWFTYGRSRMGITSPYKFSYPSAANPNYDMLGQDRWGHYKPNVPAVPNDIFPYAEQDGTLANTYASAWNLEEITLPSGGKIKLTYEADDYAYVQNRHAMRMVQVVGMGSAGNSFPTTGEDNFFATPGSPGSSSVNRFLYYELPDDFNSSDPGLEQRLFDGIDELYFRFKVYLWPGTPGDHVSGYARIGAKGFMEHSGQHYGWVELTQVQIDEGNGYDTHPIFRSALEYLQLNYPEAVSNSGAMPVLGDNQNVGVSFIMSILGSLAGFVTGIADFFQGPNAALAKDSRATILCRKVELDLSWIRLNDPDNHKKGGGHRVARVAFSDGWASMETSESDKAFTYAQRYTYGDQNGSWGVAAFEPMMGADENPFRKPVYTHVSNALSPDQRFYLEEPFGEALFPSPVVGYSKVVVTDETALSPVPSSQGTGRVEHEFYTAKDFPTRTSRTGISPDGRRRNNANIFAILGFKKVDHMHASQGFVVETNDMHGKPKKVSVYPEGSNAAVSYVLYKYGEKMVGGDHVVVNTETTIDPQGNIGRADIGRDYEFVADTRQFKSKVLASGADVKFELLYAVIAGIPVPLCLPQISSESTRYKTGVLVKKVHRFGRVQEIVKMDNGSTISTENLAYDAMTGKVLVTRTANDFKDPVYSMEFPAYWHYDGMGPAYKNIGVSTNVTVSNSTFEHAQATTLFVAGDELALSANGNDVRAWVDNVSGTTVTLTRRQISSVAPGAYRATVIRSGRRNLQGTTMMTLTSLSNPLTNLNGNVYSELLNSNAVEFDSEWETDCHCYPDDSETPILNNWVLNQRGVWRLKKENVWLTDRSRSEVNNNSNIRKDGVYSSFDPFYKVLNGSWTKDISGWTTSREITHYNNNGQELENTDALGLFSSATFGYRGSLAKSVSRNSMYRESGFDGFEDPVAPQDCADQHFRFPEPVSPNAIIDNDAHTGRKSVLVTAGNPLQLYGDSETCIVQPCKTSITLMNDGTFLAISSTANPVTVSYEILEGDVSFTQATFGLNVVASGPWLAVFLVTDNQGCTKRFTFNTTL